EDARKLYNAMIDKRPRVIAQCADVADVIAAVKTGRETGLDVAVRGGGHNGPGLGSVDDGLVIDLSLLRGVIVEPKEATAQVVGGLTLWNLDRAGEIMAWYRDFIGKAPETLNGWFAFVTVPPVDPFPEHLRMQKMCGVIWCWTGRPNEADEAFAPVRELKPDL